MSDCQFTHDGRTWIARLAGSGAYGTGGCGLGVVEAVHFFDVAEPDRPLREVLVGRGEFDAPFDAELVRLLAASRPIVNRST